MSASDLSTVSQELHCRSQSLEGAAVAGLMQALPGWWKVKSAEDLKVWSHGHRIYWTELDLNWIDWMKFRVQEIVRCWKCEESSSKLYHSFIVTAGSLCHLCFYQVPTSWGWRVADILSQECCQYILKNSQSGHFRSSMLPLICLHHFGERVGSYKQGCHAKNKQTGCYCNLVKIFFFFTVLSNWPTKVFKKVIIVF